MKHELSTAALFTCIALGALYAISIAWVSIAFYIVQVLLDKNIIPREEYTPWVFLGAPFDVLTFVLTILSVIAGVMIAVRLLTKGPQLTRSFLRLSTVLFFIGYNVLLIWTDGLETFYRTQQEFYGNAALFTSLLWFLAPTLTFYLASKKFVKARP